MGVYNLSEEVEPIRTLERIADKIEDKNMVFDAVLLRKAAREADHAVKNFAPLVNALTLLLSVSAKNPRYPNKCKIIEEVEESLINAKRKEE